MAEDNNFEVVLTENDEEVIFSRGPKDSMPDIVPGQVLFTTDTGEMFFDDTETSRVQVKDSTKLPLTGGSVTGDITVTGNVTAPTFTGTASEVSTSSNTIKAISNRVASNTSAINVLNGTGEGSVSRAVSDGIAEVVAGAPESLDTLKEIADWIAEHPEDTTAMNTQIQKNTTDITSLQQNKANKSDIGSGTLSIGITSTTVPGGTGSATVKQFSANSKDDVNIDLEFTEYGSMTGASSSAAGNSGLVPSPAAGDQSKYLRGDGTWQTPPDTKYTLPAASSTTRGGVKTGYIANGKNYPVQLNNEQMYVNVPWTDNNTTYSNMTGASASAAGKAGLVPAPAAGNQSKYLRGDGTWQTPPDNNTTYSVMTGASSSAAGNSGLVPSPAASSTPQQVFLSSSAAWRSPFTPIQQAAGLDLNNFKTSGVYSFPQANAPSNIPPGVVNGWLIVLAWSTTTVKQIWLRLGTLNNNDYMTYVRTLSGTTWSYWRRFYTNADFAYVEATLPYSGGVLTSVAATTLTIPTGIARVELSLEVLSHSQYTPVVQEYLGIYNLPSSSGYILGNANTGVPINAGGPFGTVSSAAVQANAVTFYYNATNRTLRLEGIRTGSNLATGLYLYSYGSNTSTKFKGYCYPG